MTFDQAVARIRRDLAQHSHITVAPPRQSIRQALRVARQTSPAPVLNADPLDAEIRLVLAEIEEMEAIVGDRSYDITERQDAEQRLIYLGRERDALVLEQLEAMRAVQA